MLSSASTWLVPVMLGVACIALSLTLLHNKKANKALMADMEVAQASLLQTADKERDCTKKLAEKTAELAPKDQAVATCNDEKGKLQEQVSQLTAELESFKNNQTEMKTANEKLTADLKAANDAAAAAKEAAAKDAAAAKEKDPKQV